MKKAGFTRQERSFITLMRVWIALFLLAAILFGISPDYIPNYVTNIGTAIFDWEAHPPQQGCNHFWVVMSIAMLVSLSYLCAIAQHNIVRHIGYARPVILAKFATCAGFLICFFTLEKQFLYLVSAIVDGLICLITWRFYRTALKSRS